MRKSQLGKASIAELIDIFVGSAVAHGTSTLTGDTKANHRSYDVITNIIRELRGRGIAYRPALLSLLDHPDQSVATWAAFHVLEFDPVKGETALERIAKTDGILAFNAEMTLSEWRKGNLTFP